MSKKLKQEPKILHSCMTGEFYLVTSYEELGGNNYRAKKKIDITKQLIDTGLIQKKKE